MSAYFGLDIGSSSIKLVELSGKSISLAAICANPTGKIGVDLVPSDQSSLIDAVKTVLVTNKVKNKKVVVSIPESLVYTRIMSFPVMSSPELATAIRWEAEQAIPYPIDKLELSWVVMYRPKNNSSTEKVKVLVVAVPSKISDAYVNFLDLLGLEVVRVENEAVSLVRSLLISRKTSGVSLIVDIGYSNTKMVVADSLQIYIDYLSSLGGMAFTRIVAEAFKLAVGQAEEYKRAYGLDRTRFEGKLFSAMEPVLSGLIGDIKKVIASYLSSYPDRKIDRLILSGGGAYLKGLVPVLTSQTGLEVGIGNAFEGLKVLENIRNLGTVYSVATGLATEEE